MFEKKEPRYVPQLDNTGKWFAAGPGEGLTYHHGRWYANTRSANKEDAAQCCEVAIRAYNFGVRQFQLQMQLALGFPVEHHVTDHRHFEFSPHRMREPTDNNGLWYIKSDCDSQIYNSVLFDDSSSAIVACRVAHTAYEAGYDAARVSVRTLLKAKGDR